jgi:methionine biosynthesis protein MetW
MTALTATGHANLARVERAKSRVDLLLIADMVAARSRVLDVGCGEGDLLELLAEQKAIDGRGIEISREGVNHCVARGLAVIQGDADQDLDDYPDNAFDYAILSLTIQATRRPRHVVEQLLRIGRHAIVSFPNFAHWRIRGQFLLKGRMPTTESLPHRWYDTPNIHLCSIRDFMLMCAELNAHIERAVALDAHGKVLSQAMPQWLHNIIGTQAVFLLTRAQSK